MSFILDALKKSETERAEQGQAEFSNVPTGSPEQAPMPWLWMIGGLLAVNLLILVGLLLRPGSSDGERSRDLPKPTEITQIVAAEQAAPDPETQSVREEFSDQVAVAIERSAGQQLSESAAEPPPAAPAIPNRPARTTRSVPTIDQLRLDGTLTLEPLHLDIHVYSDTPGDRFVFINMVKHREQSTLAEGPRVREITPDGVILEHRGTVFLLPRE